MKTFEENLFIEATKVVLVEKRQRTIGVDDEVGRASDRNAFYFKYYDSTFKNSDNCARIAFVTPYYFLNHSRGSDGRKDWFLKSAERKELMKILSKKYEDKYIYSGHDVYPTTYWEYLLTVYNDIANVPYEMFVETDPRKINMYLNDNKFYIPITYPFPDYTKLPESKYDNAEVNKKKDEFTFVKWSKELVKKF